MHRSHTITTPITQSIFISDPTNIRYLTGFVGAAPEEREAYCLFAQNKLLLFTNALYIEQTRNLKSQIPNLKQYPIEVIEISRENPISKELAKITVELGIRQLGFEDTNLTVAELTKLKQVAGMVEFVPARNTIETLRQIKRPDEIENIKQACRITDECFTHILSKLIPGVREAEIAWEIQSFFRKRGASNAFSPIVAFGSHSSQPHYAVPDSPSPRSAKNQSLALKSNDIILFDFGARVNGYCADMTRMVFMGEPKSDWKTAYNAVLRANQAALEYLSSRSRPGLEFTASGARADQTARDSLKKTGLPLYPHGLGHGVGLNIHEAPRLSYKKDQILKPGMVVTVEPGVYIEGQYGIRIEDLVLLKKDGIEILSKSTKELISL